MRSKASLLTFLIVFEYCFLISGLSSQNHFVNDKKTWKKAQMCCRKQFSDLASIDNIDGILKIVPNNLTGEACIGLERGNLFKWHWSLANRTFYRDREFEFRNWKEGETGNDWIERCAAMHPINGKWFDDDCNNKRHFICLQGKSNGNECFILLQQNKTWREAQAFCRENHEDSVSVRNQSENEEILKVLQSQSAWIGLFSDFMKWSDQSNSSFRFWKSKQPKNNEGKQHCVAVVLEDGRWKYTRCKKCWPFFCQDRIKPTIPLTTTETVTHGDKTTNEATNKKTSPKKTTEEKTTEITEPDKNTTHVGPNHKSTSTTRAKNTEHGTTEGAIIEGSTEDCMILIQEKKTWTEALQYCREHHINLVSVTTAVAQNWVAKKAENASTAHVWLGLRFTCVLNFWFWTTPEPGCFQNWAHGQEPAGSEECGHTGAIESGGQHQWVSLPETEKLNFICYTYDVKPREAAKNESADGGFKET